MTDNPRAFTFYWRTGKREVFQGRDPADALNRAGYGGGAIRALDFYTEGNNTDYEWVEETREWRTKPT